MADAGAAIAPAPPVAPPQAGAPLTPMPTPPAAATAQPDLVPVIDVGGQANINPAAKPGEPGSGERPVFLGAGGPVETHPVPGDDQVKKDFLASRSLAQAGNPWGNLDALISAGKAGTTAPTTPSPTTSTGSPQTPAGQAAAGVQPDDDQPIGRKLVGAAGAIGQQQPAGDEDEAGSELDLSSVLPAVGHAARDIGVGAIETPQAVLRGVIGGVENLGRTVDTVGDAIDGALPYYLGMGFPGRAGIRSGVQSIADAATEDKSEIPEPSTTTGGLIEQVAQFGTGLVGGQKAASAIGLTGRAAQVFADVFSGATSMDPEAPRMSNLIDQVAPNFITDWLKAKPGQDGALMGRLKSGLEFAGIGQLFEGIKSGLGAVKQAVQTPKTGFGPESNLGGGSQPLGTTSSWAAGNPPRAGMMPEGMEAGKPTRMSDVSLKVTSKAGNLHKMDIVGPDGSKIGEASVYYDPVEKDIQVDSVGVSDGFAGEGSAANTLGPRAMIGLRQRLEEIFPDAEKISGIRVSGAGPDRDVSMPIRRPTQPAPPLVEITPRTQGASETVLEQQAGMGGPPVPEHTGAPTTLSPEEVQDYIAGRTTVNPIRINLQRIGSGDDIRNILEQVAQTIPEPSVVSNESTIRAADALGVSPGDFLAGYKGQSLNASETTAMRFVLDSSAQQLRDFARAAIDPATNSDESRAAFLKAFATHDALQRYYVNARAEAGRTLQAWSIMSQTRSDYSKAVQQIIEQAGSKNVDQMASDVASLDDPVLVSRLVAASQRGTGRDTFLKTFYNVLLSNPRTVVKKLASDTTVAMWNLASNYAAEKGGASGAVAPGETGQLAYGYVSSLKDGIRMAGKGLTAGESQFFKQFNTMDWMDKSRLSAMANGAPEMIPDEMPVQAGASYLRAALPTSWIGAADDFAKYVNYRAYVRSLSYRDGISQGLDGPDLATHIAQNLDNVPDSIHQEALANTLRSTFQEPLTGVLKQIQDLTDNLNVPVAHTRYEIPVGRIILPFVKTPANIMRWSYNNSPLALMSPSSTVRSEMAAGGATRDLAMARIWLGSGVALGFADFALNNVITGAGPRDPQLQRAWRAAGNEPYSVQFPGQRPVSYNMVEPLGMMMGAVADSFNIMKFARDDGRENIAASLMFGAGQAMLSKTYLQGVANVLDALNDPERQGDRVAQSLAMTFLSPQGLAATAHASDPYIRYHRTLLENEESRLPIVSQGLPPARTLWGDPIPQKDAYLPFMPTDGFTSKMLSPWQLGPRPEDVEPIDQWIWNNRSSFPRATSNQLGISKPSEFQSFEVNPGTGGPRMSAQVHLDPAQYDRFQALAGNDLKNPDTNMGAKDTLNALVTGTYQDRDAQASWNQASPAMRALWVQRVVNGYRRGAQVQLRQEYPAIEDTIQQAGQARSQQLQGQ